ncbi:MAG TPA: radical SAM protein, partial [Leptospiraceae bacterium]|nr:radical SAM protein [Leptospiraceae bacterium]
MLSIETTSRLTELQRLEREYRQIPFEAILKQDVLRLGLAFEESSLKGASFKAKDYFIFTFDHVPLSEQDAGIRFKVPEEIRVEGGPFQLLPTVISVRVSPDSPYIVK